MDLRGTIRTFRFLSLLSARWPAAQSPMVNRGVWLQISWKNKIGYLKLAGLPIMKIKIVLTKKIWHSSF